eukprot:scaffold3235_cov83-Cylindrotheca_fusiformis.AAC.2
MSLRCFSSISNRTLLKHQFVRNTFVSVDVNNNISNNNNKNDSSSPAAATAALKRYYVTDSSKVANKPLLHHQSPVGDPKPTVEIAQQMPITMGQMENGTLVTIAALGDHQARCEVLKRHIMTQDHVDYDKACEIFEQIALANRGAINFAVYPYFIGIGAGMFSAFAALPLVFDLNTALWFNEDYVTTDIPEPRDLETMLEVGAWTWNWMEPPLGTFSFVLLCLQFAR